MLPNKIQELNRVGVGVKFNSLLALLVIANIPLYLLSGDHEQVKHSVLGGFNSFRAHCVLFS